MAAPNNHVDFVDPNWPGAWGIPPIPSRRAPGARRKTQLVWPRDKKQRGAHTWSRFWDVLSTKGPDMWVGKQGDIGPTKPEWSGWDIGDKGDPRYNNLGYFDERDEKVPPWRLAHRGEQKRYNFKNRKYEEPRWLHPWETWSDVKWDSTGQNPLYMRNAEGHYRIDEDLTDRLWEHGIDHHGRNPFVHDPNTNWWNAYVGQLPRHFYANDLGTGTVQPWHFNGGLFWPDQLQPV